MNLIIFSSDSESEKEQFNIEEFKKTDDYIKQRFTNAKFTVSCFDTIDEVDNKILCSDDMILYKDYYTITNLKTGKNIKEYNDYFLIKKRPDKDHIYYCDVIDELIKNDFERKINCDHKFLENIRLTNNKKRNTNALNIYSSFWGS